MRFADLAAAYERLEATPKRLEVRTILAELLRPLAGEELEEVVYLSQGILRPEYEGIELGVADSLARRGVSLATGTEAPEVARRTKASGDLGRTTEELLTGIRRLDPPSPLDVRGVYAELRKVAEAKGEGSQEEKVRILTELLRAASPLEARFLVRFVLGTLRVGVREMTILDALAVAFADGGKEARAKIEGAFNLSSDLGRVARTVASRGLEGLATIGLEVGRPVRPMLAEREPTLAEVLARLDGAAALEYKYDGLRVQAHLPADGPPRLFSRRLEEIGAQFPDLLEALPGAIRRRPAIVEGECVPIDPDTEELQPFQEVARRRGRKHDLARVRQEVPVSLFLFDVLLAGHTPTYSLDFPERRAQLEAIVRPSERIRLATQKVVHEVAAATTFLDEAISAGAEGIVAKSVAPGSGYRAGARGFWWIKYKRDYTSGLTDSIDGVVVGAFQGRGRRAGRFGAFLLAVYDPTLDRFPTFCKVGSGFDDARLAEMPDRLRPFAVSERPRAVDTGLTPDAWFRPGIVLEIRGAELTLSPVHRAGLGSIRAGAGFALRFPRFTGRIREDKGPTDATTVPELVEMYRGQERQEAPRSTEESDRPP